MQLIGGRVCALPHTRFDRAGRGGYARALGFYEPAFVLVVIAVIYGTTRVLRRQTKRRLLWWGVALILMVAALGVSHSLLRHGSFPSPALQD